MLASFKLEMIGSGAGSRYQSYMGRNTSKPWVARLRGLSEEYGFDREFVHGQWDYSKASGTGARGIFVYYALKPGIYEVNERVSWKHVDRYFIRVTEGAEVERISREEVLQCLTSDS
jgi:hypothetical protein